jgi:hypothetical protein
MFEYVQEDLLCTFSGQNAATSTTKRVHWPADSSVIAVAPAKGPYAYRIKETSGKQNVAKTEKDTRFGHTRRFRRRSGDR